VKGKLYQGDNGAFPILLPQVRTCVGTFHEGASSGGNILEEGSSSGRFCHLMRYSLMVLE
jgi:hypothetical protein